MIAVGWVANTAGLNLGAVGVETNRSRFRAGGRLSADLCARMSLQLETSPAA